jgi:GABA permease
VPARAILLGSAFGFLVMLMRDIAPEKLFNFLLNSCGALMMFTYVFVAIAHFRFPYSKPELRSSGGAPLIAGGAALAMLAVLVAMCVIPSKQPEMWASLACLGVIVAALLVKRALSKS